MTTKEQTPLEAAKEYMERCGALGQEFKNVFSGPSAIIEALIGEVERLTDLNNLYVQQNGDNADDNVVLRNRNRQQFEALAAANARAELRDRIFVQVYKAVERIAPENVELLCVLGSIGDSLPDTDALECLEQFNEHGTYKTEVLFDVSDTPTDRRKRFKLVALADDAKEVTK